ncbi:MAG TPA: SDR family NAD(P)-dependent oxidoreductase [Stellaceae bacterium]|nr:SDR family NAD(P)-dependent oxidoreductase [Stellaceae bacterium]
MTPASDRVALVTGASAGIGLETALGLARAGFRVVMAGRDAARTELARVVVIERLGAGQSGGERIETALGDFASLAAVRSLAETVLGRHDRLDVLVNNAGLIAPRYQLSQDGYELTIAVNHLAPFLLTNLLLDRLRASAPGEAPASVQGRIITVASQAHRGERLDLRTWMNRDGWGPLQAYGRSKLCNILFTRALARRLAERSVVAAALHPGVIATKIADSAGSVTGFGWWLAKPFLASPERGARTTLFLATTPDPARFHGAYLIDRKPARPDPTALDDALAEQLWVESARLVGL